MKEDVIVTVPEETKTPPPCKHKCNTCENPIGAMGIMQAWLARTPDW